MNTLMAGSENRIAEVRKRKYPQQTAFAEALGWSRSQLANIESGNRKVDLPELRTIARLLDCSVIDLLLPEDAPNQPDESEAQLLAELRAMEGYDPRAMLAAARGVIQAARAVQGAMQTPKTLSGDPALVKGLTARWDDMDDTARKKALNLLDSARDFSR